MSLPFPPVLKKCVALICATLPLGAFAAKESKPAADKPPQAFVDYLRAISLADEGSKPEALRLLAESLRLQPKDNPAAALAFQLLTEQRTNSCLLLRGHTGPILHGAFSPDGTKIITASADHTARIWDAKTGASLTPPLQHEDEVVWAEFSPDSTLVATGSEDGAARIWDAKTGKLLSTTDKDTDEIKFVRFSDDGKLLAGGSEEDGHLWDVKTGKPAVPAFAHRDNVFSIRFSPDGKHFATALGSDKARIWDIKTGKPILEPMPHGNRVYVSEYSPDGSKIFTVSADRTGKIWDAKTAKLLATVEHGFWLHAGAFNHKGTRVATASSDHTARVWDAATGKPVTPPLQHADPVFAVAFSPDDAYVATASHDHTARVWNAATGEPVTMPLRFEDDVNSVAFNPAGDSLLVTSSDGTARTWDLPPASDAPAWLADLAEFVSRQLRYDQAQTPDIQKVTELRAKLLASDSKDPWDKFGRWYFAEGDVRGISPWSPVSLQQYVDGLIALGDKASLDYAMSLSQDHPAWMVKLVPLRAKFGPLPPPVPQKDAD